MAVQLVAILNIADGDTAIDILGHMEGCGRCQAELGLEAFEALNTGDEASDHLVEAANFGGVVTIGISTDEGSLDNHIKFEAGDLMWADELPYVTLFNATKN